MMTDVPQVMDRGLFIRTKSNEKTYFKEMLRLKDEEKYQLVTRRIFKK